MRRALLVLLGVAALAAVVVVGLGQRGDTGASPVTRGVAPAQAQRMLRGAPPRLAALHAEAGQLVPATRSSTLARLRSLRGLPVVVNKWASWCGPCREEFPVFSRVSAAYGKRVAFLGLNALDNAPHARDFLAEEPVSYPSLQDPKELAAGGLSIRGPFPVTVFFDARGHKTVHAGPYLSEAALARDIRRYALQRQ